MRWLDSITDSMDVSLPVDFGNLIPGSFQIQLEHLQVHGSCTVEA